jgi:transposase
MQQSTDAALFDLSAHAGTASSTAALPPAAPRLRRADRAQMVMRACELEALVGPEHPVRVVWEVVGRWDLSRFLAQVSARGEAPGRAATDPRILISLWLFAYTRGVSNGRELDRLRQEHDAYRWLCGGVSLNYHTINDFRVNYEKALDDLLTQMLATLIHSNLVKVERIAMDGTRVRAGAGRTSFKQREALTRDLAAAKAQVSAMKRQAADPTIPARRHKAQERAARQREERLEKAIIELAKVEAAKEAQKEKPSKNQPARASTTDPEARQMRMPDGGSRPAYNVQFAVATEGRAIVGVDVTNAGSDVHQSQPMREQVEQRTQRKVDEELRDGGYIGLESIDAAAAANVTVYAPVPKPRKKDVDPHEPKKTDSPAVGEWRERMGTEPAKTIYKERASTVETANAECKTYRGLTQLLVRGIVKVRCVGLWCALAYNLTHFARHLVA